MYNEVQALVRSGNQPRHFWGHAGFKTQLLAAARFRHERENSSHLTVGSTVDIHFGLGRIPWPQSL